jgi:transposase-like protein
MNDSHDDDQNAPFSKDDAAESARGVHSGISKTGEDSEPIDNVDAVVVPDARPDRKGRQGAALRRGTEMKRVRGFESRRRLIELHVFSGKRLPECARELGLSYGRTLAVWKSAVEEVHGSRGAPEEHLRSVRAYLDRHLRRVIEESQKLVGEAAAYGAVVVAAGKALAELHGVKDEKTGQPATTLEDVGREVRMVSPLLLERLDQIRGLSDSGGQQAESPAAGITVGGVPVEGATQERVMADGAKSPLLDGSMGEHMVHGLMRVGERAVARAQLDGADAAMTSVPNVGVPGGDGREGTK